MNEQAIETPVAPPADPVLQPPEGWQMKKEWYGVQFRLVFDLSTKENGGGESRYLVDLQWFSAAAELRQLGPSHVSKKNQVEHGKSVPLAAFAFANSKVMELLMWLRTAFSKPEAGGEQA